MRTWIIWLILLAGVVGAAIGATVLQTVPGPETFGWTAYAPLSSVTYRPPSAAWIRPASIVMLTVGAGTVGATATALLLRGGHRQPHDRPPKQLTEPKRAGVHRRPNPAG